jgi:hypothetical protein
MDLPKLRSDQLAIARHPAKTKVLSMGRRWGKTVLGGTVCGNALAQHGRVAWIAPTYKNTRPMWRWLLMATAADVKAGRMGVSRSDRTIETRRGGFLGIFSGDNIDSVRGEAFHLVVVDEAARIPETAWSDAIMPTLADYGGDAILISTPKGKNWFHSEWMRGVDGNDEIASWRAPTSANPNPNIKRAFQLVKDRVPEDTYRQEWLADFVDGGAVFRNIKACMNAPAATPEAHQGHTLIAGIDWGKQNDFTCISIGCRDCKCEVAKDRFNQIDYVFQRDRLKAIHEKWKPAAILCELNSIGQPNFEMLQRDGLPVHGFTTTASTKPPLIENMALAFERAEWQFQQDSVWTMELEAFERTVSSTTGRSSYSAPDGAHDDTVIARALMLWQANNMFTAGTWGTRKNK